MSQSLSLVVHFNKQGFWGQSIYVLLVTCQVGAQLCRFQRQEEKIVEILHSFGYGEKTPDGATVHSTDKPATVQATTSTSGNESAMERGDLLESVVVADACSSFEILDHGHIEAEADTGATSAGEPTKEKKRRGRPPKSSNKPTTPEKLPVTVSAEEMEKKAEIMRKMRDEEEAVAAMSLQFQVVPCGC